jgi:hypothetical protein
VSETGAEPQEQAGPEVPGDLQSAVSSMLGEGKTQDDVRAAVQQAIGTWHSENPEPAAEETSPTEG